MTLGISGRFDRAVAPRDLHGIAAACAAHAATLDSAAANIAAVSNRHPWPPLPQVTKRLECRARRLAEWAADLHARAAAVERLEQAAVEIVNGLSRAVQAAVSEAIRHDGTTHQPGTGIAAAYRCLDALLLDPDVSAASRRRTINAAITDLDAGHVVMLVDALIAGGHDLRAIAEVGRAVGATKGSVSNAILDAFAARVVSGDLVAITFVGHLAGATTGEDSHLVASWLAKGTGRTAATIRGSLIRADVVDGSAQTVDAVVRLLGQLDDVEQIAALVVELVAAQNDRIKGPDPEALDRAIVSLIGIEPRAVVAQLAMVADREAHASVAWMRHLITADDGPDHLAAVVDGVLGPDRMDAAWFSDPGEDHTFANAATAAYLATSLSIAVIHEAGDAQHEIGLLASAATTAEILMPAVSRAVRAVEVLIPVGLSLGVGAAASHATAKIDDAAGELLERIAERFEVPRDATSADLAGALAVFDEYRDDLVRRWAHRR